MYRVYINRVRLNPSRLGKQEGVVYLSPYVKPAHRTELFLVVAAGKPYPDRV